MCIVQPHTLKISDLNAANWQAGVITTVLFGSLYLTLLLGDVLVGRRPPSLASYRQLTSLAFIVFLPLPLVLIAVLAYQALGLGTLLVIGAIPVIFQFGVAFFTRYGALAQRVKPTGERVFGCG